MLGKDIACVDQYFSDVEYNIVVNGAWERIKKGIKELAQQSTNTGSPKCAMCNERTVVYQCEINAEPGSPFCNKYRTLRASA